MKLGTRSYREVLRRLAINDESFVASALTRNVGPGTDDALGSGGGGIDDHTRRLVELAALIAIGSGPASIDAAVSAAFGAGASPEEVVEVLLAIAPDVGAGRVVSAAPHVASAIGYDLDADLGTLNTGGFGEG